MYQWLFRNKLAAIAIVILMLAGVRALIGNQSEDIAVSHTNSHLIAQREQVQKQMNDLAETPPPPDAIADPPAADETGYADDDSLIDDTKGFDPTPQIDAPEDPSPDVADNASDNNSSDTNYAGDDQAGQ